MLCHIRVSRCIQTFVIKTLDMIVQLNVQTMSSRQWKQFRSIEFFIVSVFRNHYTKVLVVSLCV